MQSKCKKHVLHRKRQLLIFQANFGCRGRVQADSAAERARGVHSDAAALPRRGTTGAHVRHHHRPHAVPACTVRHSLPLVDNSGGQNWPLMSKSGHQRVNLYKLVIRTALKHSTFIRMLQPNMFCSHFMELILCQANNHCCSLQSNSYLNSNSNSNSNPNSIFCTRLSGWEWHLASGVL
jgi:hypothetical protein